MRVWARFVGIEVFVSGLREGSDLRFMQIFLLVWWQTAFGTFAALAVDSAGLERHFFIVNLALMGMIRVASKCHFLCARLSRRQSMAYLLYIKTRRLNTLHARLIADYLPSQSSINALFRPASMPTITANTQVIRCNCWTSS